MPIAHKTVEILGVPIACATYDSAAQAVIEFADRGRPAAVSACNTHLVSAARHSPQFLRALSGFDLILPDGMPLKWILNQRGAGLKDRVYGPYFMRHLIQKASGKRRHYFFGGKGETLQRLIDAVRELQPDAEIAGYLSPPFRPWTEEENLAFSKQIADTNPDFIWVALGGVRQETWIARNLHLFKKGVFLAVGDAFELLAGNRAFAPAWMQRLGLTWLYRLLQEPGRLWIRYAKHNSLFVLQMLFEAVGFSPTKPLPPQGKTRIAFLGLRGVPARYAGFETVAEELGSRLAANGHEVTVYNRTFHYPEQPAEHRGMRLMYLPTWRSKNLETILHSALATVHACFQNYEIIYLCGVGNACLARMLQIAGKRIIINVDGIDFKRSKWSGFARWWLKQSEVWAIRFTDHVVADNFQVVDHYRHLHHHDPVYIAYGANTDVPKADVGVLARFGLESGKYILVVSRLSPENEVHLVLEAYRDCGSELPLVITGGSGYEASYFRRLQELATGKVVFTGAQYGEAYRELSQNCAFFVLPAAIEATRLVLLDQMGFGNAILFRDCRATREVIGDAGEAFDTDGSASPLSDKLRELSADPGRCRALGESALARVKEHYDWNKITGRYERLIAALSGVDATP